MARKSFGGTRIPKHWEGTTMTTTALSADATGIGFSFVQDEAWTVMRMIGEIMIRPEATLAAGDHCNVGIGIGVVSTDAVAVGGTAVPDPVTEGDYPWLYWRVFGFDFQGTDLESASASNSVRETFDVRSMRKLKPRESLAFIFEYEDGSGAPPLLLKANARILIGR